MGGFKNYPYARKTEKAEVKAYSNRINTHDFMKNSPGDDDGFYDELDETKYFVMYEAPRPDDKGRGHLSIWEQEDGRAYSNCFQMSGDDGMIYQIFIDLQKGERSLQKYVGR